MMSAWPSSFTATPCFHPNNTATSLDHICALPVLGSSVKDLCLSWQDMPAFTLMGEYCGVVKTGDAAEAAAVEDPMGFGGLKNDKLKDFCHSHPERNVRPQGTLLSVVV